MDTPAYRVMARVDWNANQNNKVSFRFTKTHTKDSNFPTSSVSPLSTSALYPGGTSTEVINGKPVGTIAPGQGRTSKYALSFRIPTIIKCVILLLLQVNGTLYGSRSNE